MALSRQSLNGGRKGLRYLTLLPRNRGLQRNQSKRPIYMDNRIKLLRQSSLEVVTDPLCLRPVDHADGAFEQRPGERVAYRLSAQRQDEVTESRFVEERFDTIRQRAANDLALRRLVPIGRCGNFAGVRGEAKQKGSIGVTLAHELTQVELAGAPHLRRARVAKMGVVGPDDDLRIRSEMIKQPVQRLCHVPVAQVPGAHASTKHRAVIALRVSNDLGILTRREELVAELTARFDRGTSAAHFEQLFDYTLLAALSQLK